MECLTEFTCSVFVDGELPEHELRQVEEHLRTCQPCRGMAAALREENRLLVHFVQEIDLMESVRTAPARSARPASVKDVVKFGGLVIGLATLIKLVTSSPENFELPSIPISLDWLDPSSLYGRLNWFVGAVVFVVGEGVSRMTSFANDVSMVALMGLFLVGAAVLVRRSIGKSAMVALMGTLAAIVMIVASSTQSYAMDIRNVGQNNVVVIRADEVVDDSVFATGDAVIVDGTINGDLFAFARQVTVHGTVKGNIITGAQSIDISGNVEGSILAGGQTIQFSGHVVHNMFGFGQSTTIGKDATVGGDVVTGGNESHLNGTVAHDFFAFGFADIAGNVGRNVSFSGANLSVLPTAKIAGNLTAHSQKQTAVRIDPGSFIGGKQSVELPKKAPNKYATFGFYFSQMLHIAAAFVAGLILLLLFPSLRRVHLSEVVAILKSGGIGFLAMVAMPIAAFILMITLIGIPVALVGFFAWILGLYLAKIIIANFIGRTLLSSSGDRMSSVALGLLVGLAMVFVAINLPVVGGLVHFILVMVGFGALIVSVYDCCQASRGSGI